MSSAGAAGERDDRDDREGSTSRSLLACAKGDDPAAWERLVLLYAPLVASWCRRWGVAEQDIVDLLQDVFISVSKSLQRFRKEAPSDTFRGWLLTIARNKVRDYARRSDREPTAAGGTEAWLRLNQVPETGTVSPDHDAAEGDALDDPAFNLVLHQALESIRSEFHERTWQAFWGVVVDGRSAADVGSDLNMAPGTVRVAKSRVLLRLRRELGNVTD